MEEDIGIKLRNFVTPKVTEFPNMEFREIPRNLGQFQKQYGIYGIKKNIWNSV
jgi:hypothetical protein